MSVEWRTAGCRRGVDAYHRRQGLSSGAVSLDACSACLIVSSLYLQAVGLIKRMLIVEGWQMRVTFVTLPTLVSLSPLIHHECPFTFISFLL